jgi:hypothetical protein
LFAVALLLAATMAGGPQSSVAAPAPVMPSGLIAAADGLPSSVVRRDGLAAVSELQVPASLRRAGVPPTVWRVSVPGSYPPRALRYEILSGGRRVGFGVPSFDERSLTTVTADSAVLSGHITVRYGNAAVPPGGVVRAPVAPRAPSAAAPSAPGALPDGPFAVTRAEYNLGTQVFQPSGITGKVDLVADVHYPTNLSAGPFPLVVFQHGNHSTCYRGNQARYEWPCASGWTPLPNYNGYDYIARRLASFGFIVVSTSANGVNVLGNQVGDTGMRQRGEVLEKHLDLWNDWSTVGGAPFGSLFVGKVDMTRIGVMGHSRGGEGAVWNVIVDRERATPYGIDAVLPLAPVDFTGTTINNVPLEVVLPYCDGDVSDLQGMHFFDDARYRVAGDSSPKGTVTVMGANHNFFNTVWSPSSTFPGTFDDSACVKRLTEAQQRNAGSVFIVSYFRRYVAGTVSLDPMWIGSRVPSALAPVKALVTYLAPDDPAHRVDLHRFLSSNSLAQNTLGGDVTTRLTRAGWCADTTTDPCLPGPLQWSDVHIADPGQTTLGGYRGLGQGVLGWSASTGTIKLTIPPGSGNVSALSAFQFRVAVNPGYKANKGIAVQNLTVELTDASGARAGVAASSINRAALAFPPEMPSGHMILNQLRFPLGSFTGIDLANVTAIRLIFGATAQGVVDVSDMAFTRGAQ